MTTANSLLAGISVVAPLFNERENIYALHAELTAALQTLGRPYEILVVDDGSRDGSVDVLKKLAVQDEHLQLVLFRRNFGQTSALRAGIDLASHEIVVTIDSDLQNDPADIGRMVARLEEGYDLVHGWRQDRKDAAFSRKLPSRVANWLISRVTHFPIHDLGCTLKVMRRDILEEVDLYGDMHRFIPILLYQRGARCTEMAVHHRPRLAGQTKYGLSRTLTVLLDLVTVKYFLDHAAHPMGFFGKIGVGALGLSMLVFVTTVIMKVFSGIDMTGNPLLLMSVLACLAGLQLLSIGVIGEVLARIYFSTEHKRPYAIRETVNIGADRLGGLRQAAPFDGDGHET